MSGSYLSLHYHIVFSTKNREPFIASPERAIFYDYLGGILNGLGAYTQGIGGTSDHVHLLIGLKATHCLAEMMRELKKASSIQAKEAWTNFSWQEGYAAFTVSASSRERVKQYIANQESHHRGKSFREELEEMLQRSEIEYDPKYLD